MRSATMLDATRRLASRELMLGGFTFLMAVVGLAALAAVAIAGTSGALDRAGAQGGAGGGAGRPSLVVVGDGEARAPAETATLQLVLGPSPFQDQFVTGGGDGAGNGEPGAEERASADPIVAALQGRGVAPADIRVVVSPALFTGYYGPGGGLFGVRLDVTVRQPSLETLNGLVNTAAAAALENNRGVAAVGVAYAVADCAEIERQARERAIAAARARAEAQAGLLGAPLGALVVTSDEPLGGDDGEPVPVGACSPPVAGPSSPFGDQGNLSVPAFDPAAPAEASARVRVSMTFALDEG